MVGALVLGGISAVGSLIGGLFGKKKEDAAAKAYKQNAAMARDNAAITRAGTALDMERLTRAGMQAAGSISAGAGASGLKTSGSALDILRESAQNVALDKQMRNIQGEINARGYEMEANNFEAQAAGAKAQGKAGLFGGILQGASSLLSGGLF